MTAEVDMKKTIQRALAFSIAAFAAVAALAAESVAFFSNLKGEVTVNGAKPQILAELSRGQKITVGKDAQASVMFIASGKEFPLQGPGEFVVQDAGLGASSGAAPAARTTEWRANTKVLGQVAQTSAASVRMRSIAPAKAAPALTFPTQGNIATLQPTFRWAEPGPAMVTLSIAGEEKPVITGKTSTNNYRVPAKLKPDTDYVWMVKAGDKELGTARFRTLPSDAVAQAEKRKPSEKAEFSDRLMYALMLQDLGAVQEAQEQWAKLSKERSDLPELAGLAAGK
jgi:hypothetical protein